MSTFVIGDVHGRRAQLRQLLALIPRDPARDTLVLLGDLVDRGEDVPGTLADVLELHRRRAADNVHVLRGNHEQMLLDFLDDAATLWLHPAVGGDRTFAQYTGYELTDSLRTNAESARRVLLASLPAEHIEFIRALPLFHEDECALYVHAGLDGDKHPRETDARHLIWSRDPDFFRHYHGKPCVFGHTPTPLLPLLGRLGRHGIYISHSAIGIDTGYSHTSPLSCLQLPEFILYQTFWGGRTATRHFHAFVPEHIRALRREESRHERGGPTIH